jgi:lysophospholipase L1-like esterase
MSEHVSGVGVKAFRCISRAVVGVALIALLSACNFGDQWFATWYAAPQNYNVSFPNNIVPPPPPITIANQSVRQIVHTSRGGNQARIKLSNLLGTEPVMFAAVRVARSTGSGSIDLSTDQPVRFSGATSVTLAPGEERWSDGVDLRVPTQSDLAISVYVPDSAPVVTAHSIGKQTNYIAAGNQVNAAAMSSPTTIDSYFWLSGVDVSPIPLLPQADASAASAASDAAALAADDVKVLVAFGDSITDSYGSTTNANHRWPNLFDDRVQAAGKFVGKASVVNAGIAGNRWLNDGVGPSGQSRFARDVLGVSGVSHVIILLGINDIGIGKLYAPQNVSADQIIAAIQTAIAQAKAQRIKVYLATLLPYGGAAYYDATGEAKRQAVNAFVRSAPNVDGVIDFDKAMQDPSAPTRMLAAYDSGDHLHPNDLGNQAMADAVSLTVLKR